MVRRASCFGCWPPDSDDEGTNIAIYRTKGGNWVGWITQCVKDDAGNREDVVQADSEDELVSHLKRHKFREEDDDYLAARQDIFPDRDIWVEDIE